MMLTGTTLWIVGVTILCLWLPQNAQHEGMHSLAAKYFGAEITRFTPYPNWKNGHFAWASMAWKGGEYGPLGRAFISIAPQLANTVLLTLLLVAQVVLTLPTVIASVLAGWTIVNYLDGMWNLGTFYKPEPEQKYTDGWSFQENTGINKWACRVGAGIWHVLFAALIVLPW